jgi:hypothetical protein
MRQIFDDNMLFHSKVHITGNKFNLSKLYDNVFVIRDTNFDKFLKHIDAVEEEIEEIKFKLKSKDGVKKYHSYKIKLDKI